MDNVIKAIAFDVVGVIRLNPSGKNILEEIADMIGVPAADFKRAYWERNHLSNIENMSWEDMIIQVVQVFDKSKDMEERVRGFAQGYEAGRSWNKDLVAMFPVLRKRGLKVGILSNATSELGALLEKAGVAPLVDAIVISGEIGHQKPHKEAFDVLFERLGLAPEQVVFVDDSPKSLEKASEIGYVPLLFKDNDQLKRELNQLGIAIG
jgi:HAD superfamily hydrolase (TIGR01549 family)